MSIATIGDAIASRQGLIPGQSPVSKYEMISPQLAARYLELNKNNRRLDKERVKLYARDMRTGKWALTHEGIAFNSTGDLVDGQTRLAAIIASGVTIQMLVTRGVSGYCDKGKNRTSSDVRQLQGRAHDFSYLACIKATARVSAWDFGLRFSDADLDHYEERFSLEIRWLTTLGYKHFAQSINGALAYAYPVSSVQVNEFAQQIFTSLGIQENSSAHAFIRMMRGANTAGATNMERMSALTLTAIKRHIDGEHVTLLKVNPAAVTWFRRQRGDE